MPKVCQDMHKCHNYHAILHKLYMWFGKNELRLHLNRAKIFRFPSKYAHAIGRTFAHRHWYYYSTVRLILIYRPSEGGRLSRPMHCSQCAARAQSCVSQ